MGGSWDRSHEDLVALLAARLRPGCTVAVADGAGTPRALAAALPEAAIAAGGDVRVMLGWCLELPFDPAGPGFRQVVSVMGGYGLTAAISDGRVDYVPCRLSSVPRLLHGALKPDVLLASFRPHGEGLAFGSEVSWMPAAVEAGAQVVAEVNEALPGAAGGAVLPRERVTVATEGSAAPHELAPQELTEELRRLGSHVAALVPEGASVQVGPGAVGEATLAALERPVRIDSGVLVDGVVDLERRGLMLGVEACTYVVGSRRLYGWADGRPLLVRIEESHDGARLSRRPLVAVNTAIEIGLTGEVNVERAGARAVGGIGGHPDYAAAASRSPGGLSVIALPRRRGGCNTLVSTLSAPVSTARTDVDVVVTERGVADLRGLPDAVREQMLLELWGELAP